MSLKLSDIADRLAAHRPLSVVRRLDGGHRNLSFLVRDPADRLFVAKTTRWSEASLRWAAELQRLAGSLGLIVPAYLPARDGRHGAGNITLEPCVPGLAARASDLRRLRCPMSSLRAATERWSQRPGFASAADLVRRDRGGDVDLTLLPPALREACRAAWRPLEGRRRTAIHGDLNTSNLSRASEGKLALIDWDEARLDTPLFDRAAIGGGRLMQGAQRARLAWEVASGWAAEPAYAQALATRLLPGLDLAAARGGHRSGARH